VGPVALDGWLVEYIDPGRGLNRNVAGDDCPEESSVDFAPLLGNQVCDTLQAQAVLEPDRFTREGQSPEVAFPLKHVRQRSRIAPNGWVFSMTGTVPRFLLRWISEVLSYFDATPYE